MLETEFVELFLSFIAGAFLVLFGIQQFEYRTGLRLFASRAEYAETLRRAAQKKG